MTTPSQSVSNGKDRESLDVGLELKPIRITLGLMQGYWLNHEVQHHRYLLFVCRSQKGFLFYTSRKATFVHLTLIPL